VAVWLAKGEAGAVTCSFAATVPMNATMATWRLVMELVVDLGLEIHNSVPILFSSLVRVLGMIVMPTRRETMAFPALA